MPRRWRDHLCDHALPLEKGACIPEIFFDAALAGHGINAEGCKYPLRVSGLDIVTGNLYAANHPPELAHVPVTLRNLFLMRFRRMARGISQGPILFLDHFQGHPRPKVFQIPRADDIKPPLRKHILHMADCPVCADPQFVMPPCPLDQWPQLMQLEGKQNVKMRRPSFLEFQKPNALNRRILPNNAHLESLEVFFDGTAVFVPVFRIGQSCHAIEGTRGVKNRMPKPVHRFLGKLTNDAPYASHPVCPHGYAARQGLGNNDIPTIEPDSRYGHIACRYGMRDKPRNRQRRGGAAGGRIPRAIWGFIHLSRFLGGLESH